VTSTQYPASYPPWARRLLYNRREIPRVLNSQICCSYRMTIRPNARWRSLVSGLILAAFCRIAGAQTKLDVFAFGLGIDAVGTFSFGTGWTFVPQADLRVRTISPGPTAFPSTTYEFSFWDATNQIIASYSVQNRLPRDENNLFHQAIPSFILKAGSPYGVLLRDPNGAIQSVETFGRIQLDRNRTFVTSPYISQFRNFRVSTTGNWVPWPTAESNADVLVLGPSFQFEVLPPKISISLTATNTALITWPEPAGVDAYMVQENEDPATANWVPISSTPVPIQGGKQAVLEPAETVLFFRLISR